MRTHMTFQSLVNATRVALLTSFIILFYRETGSSQFITHHDPVAQPSVQRPSFMMQTTDPKFGATLLRLTDARGDRKPGMMPQYSKRQAWNANDSLMLLISGDGTTHLYNGRTYQFIRELSGVYGEDIFWHPIYPSIIICTDNQALLSYDVIVDRFDTIAVFQQYDWFNSRGEGNLSVDGRYYAFVGQTYDSTVHFKDIIVYDLIGRNVVRTMPMPEPLQDFDWVSISPKGNYVVIDYATTDSARYNGIEVYDRMMNFLWQRPLGAGHSDLGIDENGDEVLVMDYYDSYSNSTWVKKFRLSDGKETNLLEFHWSFDAHISCRNTLRPGWCYVSTFDGEGRLADDSTTWLPFEDEIFALKLDGSGAVQRIAHHHSRRFSPSTPDRDNSVYYAEPHATVSRDGSKIVFGSNWRMNVESDSSVDAYLVDIGKLLSVRHEIAQPSAIELPQNYPNPFSQSTAIGYTLSVRSHVRLEVFDLLGRNVAILVDEVKEAGKHSVEFYASAMMSGVYLCTLSSNGDRKFRMIVVRK